MYHSTLCCRDTWMNVCVCAYVCLRIYTYCHKNLVAGLWRMHYKKKQLRAFCVFCQSEWTGVITHESFVVGICYTWRSSSECQPQTGLEKLIGFYVKFALPEPASFFWPGPICLLIFTHPNRHTHTQINTWRRINTLLNKKTQHNVVDPAGPRHS